MTWILPVSVSAASLAWFVLGVMRAPMMDIGGGLAAMLLGMILLALNVGVWLTFIILKLIQA